MASIQTERLLIRTFEPADLPAIHRILNAAFGALPGLNEGQALLQRESWLHWSILSQEWLPSLHQPPYGDRAVVLRSTGAVIGAVGLVPLLAPFELIPELRETATPHGHYTAEVGLYWVIDPLHQRRGYALEAGRAMVALGFKDLRLRRLLATTEDSNAASQGVMRQLGMRITRNPLPEPEWLQVVGILSNPA